MNELDRFDSLPRELRAIASLCEQMPGLLGDLVDELNPSIMFAPIAGGHSWILILKAPGVKTLRGSAWHRAVNRLGNLYGPPNITHDGSNYTAKFVTQRGQSFHLLCWAGKQWTPVPQNLTLDEVLA